MAEDVRTIAARLGIDELTVRRLQARGHPLRLDADEREVRDRLYRANVRRLRRRRLAPRPTDPSPTDRPPAAA